MLFKAYNKQFEPNRTEFDWLSRDELEVDRYVHDTKCGALSTYGLWRDALRRTSSNISTRNALRKMPNELPILITGGEVDPVGGAAALQRLAARVHGDRTTATFP